MPRHNEPPISRSMTQYIIYYMMLNIGQPGTRERNIAFHGFLAADRAVLRDWGW